jgi:hypothetical protein
MRTGLTIPAAAIVLAAGMSVALAASPVNLTQAQKQSVKQSLSGKSAQAVPAGFTPAVGSKIPQSVTLKSVPSQLASKISKIKGDKYAKLKNNDILIANSTRKVVAVIHGSSTTGSSSSMKPNENVPHSPK